MDDILLEPLKAYTDFYEKKFEENAKARLDELIAQSGVDVGANRVTVSKLREQERLRDEAGGRASRQKGLRVFLIVIAVIAFIVAFAGIIELIGSLITAGVIMLPTGIVLGVGAIVLVSVVLNKKIKSNMDIQAKHAKKAGELKKEAWEQTDPLNRLFESNETKNLIEKTVPQLKIDDNFDMHRYDYLSGKYGFTDNHDENSSTIAILSGEILGNPYVIDRELYTYTAMHTYRGTLVITWTTTHRDSEGHTHTQHHSQTLVATVTKPKPEYAERTRLIYGNEAAPDLTFTHAPSHAERMSDREYESAVKSGAKKIKKQQQKALKQGKAFTEMGNAEFDVMFGALDRNNEVQFRLLFTPLAQKNMISLMRSNAGFGDDFDFVKRGCLNYVSSEHSARWDLDTNYKRYASYDIDAVSNAFLSFNASYFKSMFFEFAPLLSIPLYQQHKPKEYIYKDVYGRNYTDYEAECAVNGMGGELFAHTHAATQSILKTSFVDKDGKSDELNVTAHAFRAEDRVEYVPVFGGDGHTHSVPVPWVEYIPVERTSTVKLKQINMTDKQFESKISSMEERKQFVKYGKIYFGRGLLCCLLKADDDKTFDKYMDSIL